MAIQNLNFNNYIYLFNNPNEITVAVEGTGIDKNNEVGLYFYDPSDPTNEGIEDFFAALAGEYSSLNYQYFNDLNTLGDAPNLNNSDNQLRDGGELVNYSIEGTNTNLSIDDFYYKITNDFGYNPRTRNRFTVENGIVKFNFHAGVNQSYNISPVQVGIYGDISPNNNDLAKDDAKIQIAPNTFREVDVNSKIEPTSLLGQKSFGENSGEPDYSLKQINGSYKYEQFSYFSAEVEDVSSVADNEAFVTSFFSNIYDLLENSPGKGYTLNSSTKIGVPYDYQTTISQDLDNKSIGVKNTRPSYENMYNYYDAQFEPITRDLYAASYLTEPALPSIYDFTYLPVQTNAMSAFLGLPGDTIIPETARLSNINQYLDNLSNLYEEYYKSFEVDTSYGPSAAIFEDKFISDWITSEDLEFSSTSDSIFNTSKSQFIKQINSNAAFTEQLVEDKGAAVPKWLQEVKTGLYFSENSLEYFNEALQYKSFFPYLMSVNIPLEQRGPLVKLFSEIGLLDSINTHAASLVVPNEQISDSVATVSNFYGGLINGSGAEQFNLYGNIRLKNFNMHFSFKGQLPPDNDVQSENYVPDYSPSDLFIDSFEDISMSSPKNVFTYTDKSEQTTFDGPLKQLLDKLKGEKFNQNLKKLLLEGSLLRSPQEIKNGALAHQETLMYEIAKYKIGPEGEQIYIQSVFLPLADQDSITYLDTQVIPYQDYFYKIFAHKAVVGTKYRVDYQSEPEQYYAGIGGALFKYKYEVQPYLQFIRVPYYNTEQVNVLTDEVNYSRIEDAPPLPPQVQIVPYRNIDNKILILLNNSSGEIKTRPIEMFDEDAESIRSTAISQGLRYDGSNPSIELLYRSDDQIGTFEAYRTDNLPLSYEEMADDPTLIATPLNVGVTSFQDNIVPNTEYYYTFRFIDVHGKLSNPTDVYRVKIISNPNSAPYLTISTINLLDASRNKENEKFSTFKTFQKYLLIQPSVRQNTVDYPDVSVDESGLAVGNQNTQEVIVGDPVINAFGKKYKLRLTSKQTGKKIDINFTFKNPKNIINDL